MSIKKFIKARFSFLAILKNYNRYRYLFYSINEFYSFFKDYYSESNDGTIKSCYLKVCGSPPLFYRKGATDQGVMLAAFHYQYQDVNINCKNSPVIFDLGANVGYCSRFYLEKYPKASIVAVELEINNYNMLLKNLEPFSNFVCYHAGIWYKDGKITLTGTIEDSFHIIESENEAKNVDSICMESLFIKTSIKYVDLVKMDIEGAERQLFSYNLDWLERVGCICLEYHDGDEKFYNSKLKAKGFDVIQNYRHWASLIAYNRKYY